MTTVYILTFKDTGEEFYYTSLKAMSLSHTKEEFRVSPKYISDIRLKNNRYENHGIIIRRVKAVGMGDIRQKEKNIDKKVD